MQHQYKKHTDGCNGSCVICDGGLSICSVCNGAEGQLTTDCCGRKLSQDTLNAVYEGRINYRNGEWKIKIDRVDEDILKEIFS